MIFNLKYLHKNYQNDGLLSQIYVLAELFNIPNWECPEALKAPFYEGL